MMPASTKSILILMSVTGGGHLATALALRSAFERLYGTQFHVDIVDLLVDHTPWPFKSFPESYRFVIDNAPWLNGLTYRAGRNRVTARSLMWASYEMVRKPVAKAVEQYAPDLVIVVHPLLLSVPMRVVRDMGLSIPFVTVITDLQSIHPTWFDPDVALCFVPTAEAHQLALDAGLEENQLCECGLPIRPEFAELPRPKEVLRRELGLAPGLPTVLLVSGAEGTGKLDGIAVAVARSLAGSGDDGASLGQVAVICGWNDKLLDRLRRRKWPVPVRVTGFVENMWDWMGASECIVTKAGPGTITEALTRGLPIVLSSHVPGQEDGNVAYVLGKEVGVYREKPKLIGKTVAAWFGPDRRQRLRMAERARRLARPKATFEIVEEIAKLMQ